MLDVVGKEVLPTIWILNEPSSDSHTNLWIFNVQATTNKEFFYNPWILMKRIQKYNQDLFNWIQLIKIPITISFKLLWFLNKKIL